MEKLGQRKNILVKNYEKNITEIYNKGGNVKIVITGGSGFVGRAIVERFASKFETIVVDKAFNPGFSNNVKYCKMDLADSRVSEILATFLDKNTILIHLAALIGGVNYFVEHPYTILAENSLIDSNVFSSLLLSDVKKVIVCSSSMVYESAPANITFKEDLINEIPPPITAYGLSKLKTEVFARSINEQYGIPYLIIRPFNAIGVGDLPGIYGHVLPTFCLRSLNKENPFKIIGNGKQVRSFLHIDDLADAFFDLAVSNIENQVFNVGTSDSLKIVDLAKLIWKQINNENYFGEFEFLPAIKYDVQFRCPNIDKITSFGWRPKHSIEDTITEVSLWLKSDFEHFNINDNRHRIDVISKAEFIEWYYDRNFSLSEISDYTGISISTLYRLLNKYNIEVKNKSFKHYHLCKELFECLYEKHSSKEISNILKIDIRVVHSKLVEYGLDTWDKLKFDSCSYQMKKVWSDFEYKAERLKKIFNACKNKSPNNLETTFYNMFCDKVKFVGNGSRWIQLVSGAKNPDFEVIGKEYKVIELFGDYWHKNDTPKKLIDKYADKKIECLVIWEYQIYEDIDNLYKTVNDFIDN